MKDSSRILRPDDSNWNKDLCRGNIHFMKKEEVKHMTQLARMNLSSEENTLFENEFKKIIDYISQIQGVSDFIDASTDTKVGEVYNVTREDTPLFDSSREEIIGLFPKKQNDYLSVKKVIEQ